MRWLLPLLILAAPTAAAEMFSSGDIAPGETWSYTFTEVNEPGHTYHCHPHPWMQGMVHVQPDSDGEVATVEIAIVEGDTADDWGYDPMHPVIEVGDTVRWTNTGNAVHTVDEDEGGEHDHGDHSHGDEGEDSPAPPLILIALAFAFVAWRRR